MGEFRLAHHHACEEGAEGEAHVEDGGGAVGDANGCGKHEEREELAGAVRATWAMIHGRTRRPTSIITAMKAMTLPIVMAIWIAMSYP